MCFTNKRKRNWIRKEDRVPDRIRSLGQVEYGGTGRHEASHALSISEQGQAAGSVMDILQ